MVLWMVKMITMNKCAQGFSASQNKSTLGFEANTFSYLGRSAYQYTDSYSLMQLIIKVFTFSDFFFNVGIQFYTNIDY